MTSMTSMITIRFGIPASTLPLASFMNFRFLAGMGCASVICWAMPLSTMPIPSVMIIGSVLYCTTSSPFIQPASAPQSTATAMAHHSGITLISLMVMMPDRLIIAPTEKSMPPQMIVSVTPKAMISRMAAELSISRRLYLV